MSDSPGLVDFAIGLVNYVLNLPDGQLAFFEEFNIQIRTVKSILFIKKFSGLVEMTFGLVYASFSLPEWQAVKMTFFAPPVRHVSGQFDWKKFITANPPIKSSFLRRSACR